MGDRKDREAEVAALGRNPEFLGRVIEAVAPCARCNHGQRSHTTNLPRCLGEPGEPPCPCVGYVYPTSKQATRVPSMMTCPNGCDEVIASLGNAWSLDRRKVEAMLRVCVDQSTGGYVRVEDILWAVNHVE